MNKFEEGQYFGVRVMIDQEGDSVRGRDLKLGMNEI